MKTAIIPVIITATIFSVIVQADQAGATKKEKQIERIERLKNLLSNDSNFCQEGTVTKTTIRSGKGKYCENEYGALLALLACENAKDFMPGNEAKKAEGSYCYQKAIKILKEEYKATAAKEVLEGFNSITLKFLVCDFIKNISYNLETRCMRIFPDL